MSQEEQDALLGKTLREYKEMSHRLEMLRARAAEIGNNLVGLGSVLNSSPESLAFDGEPMDARFFDRADLQSSPLASVSVESLKRICHEIRQTIIERDRLEKQIRSLGYSP
jgi:hypothetical protein